jgi:hypothetical protein
LVTTVTTQLPPPGNHKTPDERHYLDPGYQVTTSAAPTHIYSRRVRESLTPFTLFNIYIYRKW